LFARDAASGKNVAASGIAGFFAARGITGKQPILAHFRRSA